MTPEPPADGLHESHPVVSRSLVRAWERWCTLKPLVQPAGDPRHRAEARAELSAALATALHSGLAATDLCAMCHGLDIDVLVELLLERAPKPATEAVLRDLTQNSAISIAQQGTGNISRTIMGDNNVQVDVGPIIVAVAEDMSPARLGIGSPVLQPRPQVVVVQCGSMPLQQQRRGLQHRPGQTGRPASG